MFKNMRVGVRLTLGFVAVLILTVMLASMGIDRMQRIEDGLEEVSSLRMTRIMQVGTLRISGNTGSAHALDEAAGSAPQAAEQGGSAA